MMLAALLMACAQTQALGRQPQEPQLQPSEVEEVKRLAEEARRLGAEGRNLEGAEVFERVIVLMAKGFGPEHPNLAVLIGQLGGVYSKLGLYARAEPHYLRALAIREKAFGPEHLLVAQSLNDLALLYAAKGDYAAAEPLLRRTLAIEEKLLGPAHPNVAAVLNNLGELYRYRADYAQAESLYLRALAIEEKALGVDNPALASTLTNLGAVYHYKGDYARAEPLFLRGLAIVEKAKGPDSPDVVVSLNNLGALYHDKGDVKRAEESYRRALNVEEKAYGPDKPEVAMMLNNLGELYRETEQYDLAAPMFERALAVREKTLGPDHPDTAEVLDNLSLLLQARGDYARAEALRRRALGIIEKIYGPQHPLVAGTLINFAALYNLKGDMARAVEFNERAAEINEHNLALVLSTGSEQQKQLYLDTLAGDTFGTVSLHVRNAPNDERAARLALTAILRRKGRSLDAMADQVGALRRRATPEDRALLDQLAAARSSRAALQLSTEAAALAPAERQAREAQLSSGVERLEGEVSRRSAEFRAASLPVTFDAVRQAIPADAALVEMFSYRPFDPRKELEKFGPARYVAYVVRRDSASPLWVELGEAAAIEADVVRLREALKDPARANVKVAARSLDQRVMLPVRKLLGDVRRIFLSPDGALNLVPFAALVDESDKYLIENYSINYLTSGRDLLRLQVRADARDGAPPVVIANPTFDLAGTKAGRRRGAADAGHGANTDGRANFGGRGWFGASLRRAVASRVAAAEGDCGRGRGAQADARGGANPDRGAGHRGRAQTSPAPARTAHRNARLFPARPAGEVERGRARHQVEWRRWRWRRGGRRGTSREPSAAFGAGAGGRQPQAERRRRGRYPDRARSRRPRPLGHAARRALGVRDGTRRSEERRGRLRPPARARAGGERDAVDESVAGLGCGHARSDDCLLRASGEGRGTHRSPAAGTARDASRRELSRGRRAARPRDERRDGEGEAQSPLFLGGLHPFGRVDEHGWQGGALSKRHAGAGKNARVSASESGSRF